MSNLFHCAAAAVLVSVGASTVWAQAPQPAASSAPAASGSSPAKQAYRSAFEGYKGHAEQPVGSWQKANDVVGCIGGWRAYARETQGEVQPGGKEPQPTGHPGMPKSSAATSPVSPTMPMSALPCAPASAARGAAAEGSSSGHGGSHTDMRKP